MSQSTQLKRPYIPSSSGDIAPITIVSTYTVDRYRMPDGSMRETPGGPAHYCAIALRKLQCEHLVITGQRAVAEVMYEEGGESYRISPLSTIPMPSPVPGDAVILSPVMREIDPFRVPPALGLLFIDLQGFVREPGVFSGHEHGKINLAALLERAEAIKASERELARLDEESIEALKGTLVLLTRGTKGVELRRGCDMKFVPAKPVNTVNTIGAGDIFLASFVYFFLQNNAHVLACESAMRVTEEILAERIGSPG